MHKDDCLRVNEPTVVYEVFDNEIVIINFESSNYYSFTKSGIELWKLIVEGLNSAEIIEIMTSMYKDQQASIAEIISLQLNDLLKEGLIVISEEKRNAFTHPDNLKKISFAAPVLEKFSDMEELLLLDPIHEVQESGWPNKKPE